MLDFKTATKQLPTYSLPLVNIYFGSFLNGSAIKDFLWFCSIHSAFQRPGLELQKTSLVGASHGATAPWFQMSILVTAEYTLNIFTHHAVLKGSWGKVHLQLVKN